MLRSSRLISALNEQDREDVRFADNDVFGTWAHQGLQVYATCCMTILPELRALSLVHSSVVFAKLDELVVHSHFYGRGQLMDTYGAVNAVGLKTEKRSLREAEPDLDIMDLTSQGWQFLRRGDEP